SIPLLTLPFTTIASDAEAFGSAAAADAPIPLSASAGAPPPVAFTSARWNPLLAFAGAPFAGFPFDFAFFEFLPLLFLLLAASSAAAMEGLGAAAPFAAVGDDVVTLLGAAVGGTVG